MTDAVRFEVRAWASPVPTDPVWYVTSVDDHYTLASAKRIRDAASAATANAALLAQAREIVAETNRTMREWHNHSTSNAEAIVMMNAYRKLAKLLEVPDANA